MVKVAAPAMSLDASGKLGGAIVFSKWKGRNYARVLVTPANPRTGGQVGMRAMLKYLSQHWTLCTTAARATWKDIAEAKIISPFNAFVSGNMRRWRNFKAPSDGTPATEADAAPTMTGESATAGVRQVLLSISVDTLPVPGGIMIFRSLTGAFTTTWANCIAIIEAATLGTKTYIDTPLAAGTYYYNWRGFNGLGKLGIEQTEKSATVA